MMRFAGMITAAALLVAAPARCEDVTILTRNYSASHDIDLLPIGVNAANWLVGLDCPGEYTEYEFTIGGFGTDRCELMAMGTSGIPFRIVMTITGAFSGETQQSEFVFIGSGFEG